MALHEAARCALGHLFRWWRAASCRSFAECYQRTSLHSLAARRTQTSKHPDPPTPFENRLSPLAPLQLATFAFPWLIRTSLSYPPRTTAGI